jgi:hypothetical protein
LMQFQARYGLPETGEPDHDTETQLIAATFSDQALHQALTVLRGRAALLRCHKAE